MADRIKESAARGLFGLGGRKSEAAAAAPASPTAPPRGYSARPADLPNALEQQALRLNLKALAAAAAKGATPRAAAELKIAGLGSRAPHYEDAFSPWFAYWSQQLCCAVRPHRKLWEFIAVLQSLYEAGVLAPGARALGLGCADEPLPSYLASLGLDVVASDLPGFAERERMLHPALITDAQFDRHVEVSNIDARLLDDPTLRGFDIVWSCSLVNLMATEHEAADILFNAMDTLKPGGVAVHTTEFAFAEDRPVPNAGALALPRSFFERVAEGLAGRGHQVEAVSFDLGGHPLDGYIDLPPFTVEGSQAYAAQWAEGVGEPHLKVLSGDVLTTSFVLVVRARG